MLKCITTRPGKECFFMGKSCCTVIYGTCEKIVEKCGKCIHIEDEYCNVYAHPKTRWPLLGGCPLNSNKIVKEIETKKLNPIKASKKSAKR